MSHDGDGKPPNPFASPKTGASNPFDDLMGPSPAAAPNPFATSAVPSSRPDPDEPPAITVLRASSGDASPTEAPSSAPTAPTAPAPSPAPSSSGDAVMEALGLDIEERAPPKAKSVRPELEEWRNEMAHGAAAPTTDPLNFATVSNPRLQALSPPKKGSVLKYVVGAVAIIVALAGAGIAQRVIAKGSSKASAKTEALSETDQLLELGIRPENAPECFTRDRGFDFSYLDSGGQTVTVDSISDVPPLYRMNARCLPR